LRLRAAQQLFLTYLALIALVIVTLSIAAGSVLRRHLIATAAADLQRELALGREIYEQTPQLPPDSVADVLGALSGRRVTIVAADGRVLGDSRVATEDLPQVANHLDRPEIQQALLHRLGSDQRISATIGTEHVYLAELTDRGDVMRFALPTRELDVAIRRVQTTIFLVGGAALLLAAIFSFGFSMLVTRPLRVIAGVAREMSGGTLERRVRLKRSDELGDLADALNALAGELQRRLAQLEGERAEMQALIDSMAEAVLAFDSDGRVTRANPAAARIFALPPRPQGLAPEAVARRPDFLRLVQRAVRGESIQPTELAYDGLHLLATAHPLPGGGAVVVFLDVSELRRLEGVRRDFVANASHELKTPLTAIRGYSETLLDEDLPLQLRQQFANAVKSNADRLQRIVDDLLDLSRLESGGWRVDPQRVDLEEVASEVWSAVGQSAGPKQVEFATDIAEDCHYALVDPGGLRQILANLFSNAHRYTPPGGRVVLRTRCVVTGPDATSGRPPGAGIHRDEHPDGFPMVSVEVIDTGGGIASHHLPRIFERFYRVDPARSRAEGGTGLGLAIVKHLVEAHGGEVEAESELGRGTTIRFTLPAIHHSP
jgi:two-component system, OmpR family, phosphate regulon sensor histidine kinase PhoR